MKWYQHPSILFYFFKTAADYIVILSCYNGEIPKQWRTGMLVLLGQDFLLELRFCFPQYSVCAVCKQPVARQKCLFFFVQLCWLKDNSQIFKDAIRSP